MKTLMSEYKISQHAKNEVTNILKNISNGITRINKILENANVIENGQPIEKLTPATLKRLLGSHYTHVCIYDNENKKLITKKYHGVKVIWDNKDTENSEKLKEFIEKGYSDFDVVAQLTMQVARLDYPGFGQWTHATKSVKFDKNGECTVGNLVIRGKDTGRLELLNATGWFGVGCHSAQGNAAGNGAHWLPSFSLGFPIGRTGLLTGRRGR